MTILFVGVTRGFLAILSTLSIECTMSEKISGCIFALKAALKNCYEAWFL